MSINEENFSLKLNKNISLQRKKGTAEFFFGVFLLILTAGLIIASGVFIYQSKFQQGFISPVKIESTEKSTTTPKISVKTSIFPNKKEIIGFLPSWMIEKQIKIDFKKLTQIIYFGLGVNETGELMLFNNDKRSLFEWTYFNSDYFTNLRRDASKNGVKILVSVKNFENEDIDNLISNQTSVNRLLKQLKSLIEQYNLNGINFDFEYFTDSNFPTAKYLNKFLETAVYELKKENPKLVISFDVNAVVVLKDSAYDMVKIGEVVDQIIVMGYDYHRVNSTRAGPVAPLYGGNNEHSISQSVQSLKGRVPFEKIILAIPFYGYEWQTVNTQYKSPTVSNTGALATLKRVNELIENRDDVKINWDEKAKSPWLIYKQSGAIKQIYYEDAKSISAKYKYVKNNNLAGLAVWTLGYEGDYSEIWDVLSQ